MPYNQNAWCIPYVYTVREKVQWSRSSFYPLLLRYKRETQWRMRCCRVHPIPGSWFGLPVLAIQAFRPSSAGELVQLVREEWAADLLIGWSMQVIVGQVGIYITYTACRRNSMCGVSQRRESNTILYLLSILRVEVLLHMYVRWSMQCVDQCNTFCWKHRFELAYQSNKTG